MASRSSKKPLNLLRSKVRRTSSDHSSPRAGPQYSRFGDEDQDWEPSSPDSASMPRRCSFQRAKDKIEAQVTKVMNGLSARDQARIAPDADDNQDQSTQYRGVRYRVELDKYVSEIRPTKDKKKIWLGTYDTAEEAARAFDIGNLCCKKKIPLNFPDSPRLLRRISSKLSPDEARSAIAKLAKEVARMVTMKSDSSSDGETARRKDVDHRAAQRAHDLVQRKAEEPAELKNLEGQVCSSLSYVERPMEKTSNVEYIDVAPPEYQAETATSMPVGRGSNPSSFNISQCYFGDNLNAIYPSMDEIFKESVEDMSSLPNTMGHGDVYYHSW